MIRRFTFAVSLLFLPYLIFSQGPCTTSDASGCSCADMVSTDCDLLPDITVSDYGTMTMSMTEYSQTGNGANDGRLRLSTSTPNIGFGPLTVGAVNMWTCGTDTFTTYPGTCPGGGDPKQLIKQKIYHKDGPTMSYWERWCGSMTYHPTHGHMHVDDWATFTLRIEDPTNPDPLSWPIVGDGAKVSFCLMDLSTCAGSYGHCRDSMDNILTTPDFPNYGLGGGSYTCSPVEQGISVGFTDIYGSGLDGMWIDIPPGTCNGDYKIVQHVDPSNWFLESNENNNVAVVPVTLTKQDPSTGGTATISTSGSQHLCHGESMTLSSSGGLSYLWSNGATGPTVDITSSGTYNVAVTNVCGIAYSDAVEVTVEDEILAPAVANETVCVNSSTMLTVAGSGTYDWYDSPSGGTLLGTGNPFSTGILTASKTYYVEEVQSFPGSSMNAGPAGTSIGTGTYFSTNAPYLIFDAVEEFDIVTVMVDASFPGFRTIQLRDASGTMLDMEIVNLPAGESTVTLDFTVPVGTGYELGLANTSAADLFRNDAGVTYPYNLGGLGEITGSSAGPDFYYFFYNWEIRQNDMLCRGPRVAVEATVAGVAASFLGLDADYEDMDAPVSLIGSPAGGVFEGPGITGTTFDPSVAGVGGPYPVIYTYTDPGSGCAASDTQYVSVSPFVGIDDGSNLMQEVAVFPNPNSGQFNVRFALLDLEQTSIQFYDLAGKRVYSQNLGVVSGKVEQTFDLGTIANGTYLMEVSVGERNYYRRVMVE